MESFVVGRSPLIHIAMWQWKLKEKYLIEISGKITNAFNQLPFH